MALGRLGVTVKDNMIGSIRGAGDLVGNAMEVARDLTGDYLKESDDPAREVNGAVAEVVRGTLEAASEVRRDPGDVVLGLTIGLFQGIDSVTPVTAGIIAEAARAIMTATRAGGGDTGLVAEAAIRGAVTGSPGLTIDLPAAAFGAARGVMLEAAAAGDSELPAGKAMQGAVAGAAAVRADAIASVRGTAQGLVRGAAEAGGNVGRVARSAVAAAIGAARQTGVDPERAAAAAGTGSMQGAQEAGEEPIAAVADAVSGSIEGVEVVLEKPFARRKERV